jgi:hypothetical protein
MQAIRLGSVLLCRRGLFQVHDARCLSARAQDG